MVALDLPRIITCLSEYRRYVRIIAGYMFIIAPFCRVGGGISTEAAAVGAALSALNEYRLEENDKRIPACECVADIVDDTVGVIAGVGVVSSARLLRLCAWRWFSLHPRMRWEILGNHRGIPCSSLSSWKRGGYFDSRSPYCDLQSAR